MHWFQVKKPQLVPPPPLPPEYWAHHRVLSQGKPHIHGLAVANILRRRHQNNTVPRRCRSLKETRLPIYYQCKFLHLGLPRRNLTRMRPVETCRCALCDQGYGGDSSWCQRLKRIHNLAMRRNLGLKELSQRIVMSIYWLGKFERARAQRLSTPDVNKPGYFLLVSSAAL